MTRTNFTQLRLRLSALVAGDRATAGKVAALRRVDRLGTSPERIWRCFCASALGSGIGTAESRALSTDARVRIQIVGRSELNDIAEVHNGNTVADVLDDVKVMLQ